MTTSYRLRVVVDTSVEKRRTTSTSSRLPQFDTPALHASLRGRLASMGGVCQFLYWQRGYGIPSAAAFGKIGDGYVAEVHRWAKANGIAVRRFVKGENKEAIARPLIGAAEREGADGRVVPVGIAQEKTPVGRSRKAKDQEHAAHPHMERGRQMAFGGKLLREVHISVFGQGVGRTVDQRADLGRSVGGRVFGNEFLETQIRDLDRRWPTAPAAKRLDPAGRPARRQQCIR